MQRGVVVSLCPAYAVNASQLASCSNKVKAMGKGTEAAGKKQATLSNAGTNKKAFLYANLMVHTALHQSLACVRILYQQEGISV
jgi:hypothetical protein